MTGLLRLALIAPVAILLLVMFQRGGPGPRGAEAAFIGDANCDADVDAEDVITVLRGVSQVQGAGDCVPSLDVDCDTDSDAADALKILQFLADVEQAPIADCAAVDAVTEGTSNQQLASDLAQRITGASSDDARYRAILKVMEVLRIGVYTSEGSPVQQGAERGPGDFYYYDFELHMMAAGLGRGDNSWGVQQIADTLDQVGYREDGLPFTADDVNQIIHDATNDSLTAPEEASSLLPLLVRELGLKHDPAYDLADNLDVNEARFDPLQMTLILTALTLPVIADEGPLATSSSTLIADSNGILTTQPLGIIDTCGDFRGEGQELWPATKFFLTAVSVVSKIGKGVVGFIDVGHGSVLAFSVQVTALEGDSDGSTHYDHGPEDPGRPLQFRIGVQMLDDLGETLVKCGWLATADFPPQGPIPGVRVQFNTFSSGLEGHGTLDCTGLFCSRTTDVNGIATLTFDPKSETAPYGQGIEALSTGSLEAIAWYQSKFRNIFGTLAQFVTPKSDVFAWSVYHHGCALEVQAPSAASVSIEAITSLADLPCEWTGTAHGTIHHYINIGNTSYYDEVGTIDGTFTFGNAKLYAQYNTVTYEVISGSATWHASGHVSCSFSKGGTEQIQGGLTIGTGASGQIEYGGNISTKGQDRTTCGASDGEPIIATVNLAIGCSVGGPWVLDSLDVSGSCNSDHELFWHDEFSWHLSGISCGSSAQPKPESAITPEGVCGGP